MAGLFVKRNFKRGRPGSKRFCGESMWIKVERVTKHGKVIGRLANEQALDCATIEDEG